MIAYLITFIIFFFVLVSVYRKAEKSIVFFNKLEDYKFSVNLLLVWIVFGFFTGLDFNQMFGCIIDFGDIFDYNNIGFSLFSFALIFAARLFKNKKTSVVLFTVELLFWLIKYFFYKGGYATGLVGIPLDIVVFYDTIAIFLRLLVLRNLIKQNFKILWVILAVLILTSIKIFIFSIPHDLFWEEIKRKEQIEESTRLIKGNWKGIVQYDITLVDTIGVYKLDSISEEEKERFETGANHIVIDSLYKYCLNERDVNLSDTIDVLIDNELSFKSRLLNYEIKFTYPFGGDIIKKRDSSILLDGDFDIYKLDNDSLIIKMGYRHFFSLKRVTPGNTSCYEKHPNVTQSYFFFFNCKIPVLNLGQVLSRVPTKEGFILPLTRPGPGFTFWHR